MLQISIRDILTKTIGILIPMTVFRFFAIVILVFLYSTLFYLQFTHRLLLDFSSFYSASEAYFNGINPYQALTTTYFPIARKLPNNLNPPFVLWLLQPFILIGYTKALILWTCVSFILGIKGASIAYNIINQSGTFKLSRLDYWLIYFSVFPIFMNTAIGQVGAFLSFFIFQGYLYADQKKPWLAGVLWGLASAIKLFPLLLIIYTLVTKQKKVTLTLLITFIILSLIPISQCSYSIYINYYNLMHEVFWYGDNWNASFYGILFRIVIDANNTHQNITLVKLIFGIVFLSVFFFYFVKLKAFIRKNEALNAFNLTLVTMLLLSPFGWIYYFSIILIPAYCLWLTIQEGYNKLPINSLIGCYLSLYLLCCPIVYVTSIHMSDILLKLSLFSCHFYGLLMLGLNQVKSNNTYNPGYEKRDLVIANQLMIGIIILDLLVPSSLIIKEILRIGA